MTQADPGHLSSCHPGNTDTDLNASGHMNIIQECCFQIYVCFNPQISLTPGGRFKVFISLTAPTNFLWFWVQGGSNIIVQGFDQKVMPMFPWPLPYGASCVYLCVSMCTHMLRCLCIIVFFPLRLNPPLLNGYQRPVFTVISAWLHHGSNHCRSGVNALAWDRDTTDWRRLQRKSDPLTDCCFSRELWIS